MNKLMIVFAFISLLVDRNDYSHWLLRLTPDFLESTVAPEIENADSP